LLGLKGVFLEGVTLPFLPAYGFNTATYLFPFYEDFGVVGVLFFAFVFGLLAGRTYREMLIQKKLSYVVAYGFVVNLILLSVMDGIFVFMKFWIELGCVYAIFRYSAAKRLPQQIALKIGEEVVGPSSNADSN
jgi:oligosaccharide repeat unit polymerase